MKRYWIIRHYLTATQEVTMSATALVLSSAQPNETASLGRTSPLGFAGSPARAGRSPNLAPSGPERPAPGRRAKVYELPGGIIRPQRRSVTVLTVLAGAVV